MKRKVYYYNPYIEINGQKTDIPFFRLLDYVYTLTPADKHRNVRTGEYSLIKMRNPANNLHGDFNDRSVCLADYREKKPKIGERGSNRYEDIDDDVIESTNFFYQYSSNLLVMEYNHYGAKALQFESYMSSFLPVDEHNAWSVILEEIPAEIGLQDVLDSNNIKSLELKLDLSRAQQRLFVEENHPQSITLNAIENVANSQSEIGGNVAMVFFGNGRKKENHLQTEEVKNIIRSLDLESETYINIRVNYLSPALGKKNEIDLKNVHILKDEVEVEGDARETIADTLEQNFYENGRVGQFGNVRFQEEIITEEMPI